MNTALHFGAGAAILLGTTAMVGGWTVAAGHRLTTPKDEAAVATSEEPVAAADEKSYCTADLKRVLSRVLQSCGLQSTGEVRGCQPKEASKVVGTLSPEEFNELFVPLKDRAGIIQFDLDSSELDPADIVLLDRLFADQRGASYFFVVARASPEGSETYNRQLSEARGNAILNHLRTTFQDPDLDKEVGLLWLGEEMAQLDKDFCTWQRSGTEECSGKDLNRSALVAWIDCRI